MTLYLRILVWTVMAALPAVLTASRIKDLTTLEGGRDNQLIGYGLVIGLSGDGDGGLDLTQQSVANSLHRFGIEIDAETLSGSNVAAVMVTADIGPFMKPGARLDVTVSSIGEAESLQGGILLQTPLVGADDVVYAVAQGPVAVGGFLQGVGGAGGSTVQKNHPTVGTISGGAIVERAIPSDLLAGDGSLNLTLHHPDFTTAVRMAEAINTHFEGSALATDSATVNVIVPDEYLPQSVNFIAALGMIEVMPDSTARVVINERTGTIVATANVRVSTVAVSHGALTITIARDLAASQPNALSEQGSTVVLPSSNTNVTEMQGGFQVVEDYPSIERVTQALNALGVSTREMMSILQAMKKAGALQAELILN